MEKLAGDAHISFEGNLRNLGILTLPGSSREETFVLKRNTTWPKQDFVVLSLEPSDEQRIVAALRGVIPGNILHIQVEKNGVLQFVAYDRFDPECIFFGTQLDSSFLDSLISDGVIGHAD